MKTPDNGELQGFEMGAVTQGIRVQHNVMAARVGKNHRLELLDIIWLLILCEVSSYRWSTDAFHSFNTCLDGAALHTFWTLTI